MHAYCTTMPLTIGRIAELLFVRDNGFKGVPAADALLERGNIFFLITALYLLVVFIGPSIVKKPLELKPLFIMWNLLLSVFSILGCCFTLPRLLEIFIPFLTRNKPNHIIYTTGGKPGFDYGMCAFHPEVFFDNRTGVWILLFSVSKVPEVIDTLFLFLRKKKVIFLHWFHHATVLVYSWHSYSSMTVPGFTFSTMNYSVHAIMYTYYFICACGYRRYVRKFAWIITTLQILQMFVGFGLESFLAYKLFIAKEKCHANPINVSAGLGIYLCYLVLFCHFFYVNYMKKGNAKGTKVAGRQFSDSSAAGITPKKKGSAGKTKSE